MINTINRLVLSVFLIFFNGKARIDFLRISMNLDLTAFKLSGLNIQINNYSVPRFACSSSIDSNNALKLPFPNEVAPFRWIIS